MTDTLHSWEKWPVAALFLASGLYLFEWYAGSRLAIPWAMDYISTAGGIAAMIAVDGAMIATVAGMRQGRRSVWSVAAILTTALFAGGVALVLHGALPSWVGAWLHAGFVATIAAYLLHLAQPCRTTVAPSAPDAADDAQPATIDASVTHDPPQLPAPAAADDAQLTIPDLIRRTAAAQPDASARELATLLRTSPDTVRRALSDITTG